jgi:hypothetical protein
MKRMANFGPRNSFSLAVTSFLATLRPVAEFLQQLVEQGPVGK